MGLKDIMIWVAFAAVFGIGTYFTRKVRKETERDGIEADAVVTRILESADADDPDSTIYVRYRTEDGEEIEGILIGGNGYVAEGDNIRIKYNPKHKHNAVMID